MRRGGDNGCIGRGIAIDVNGVAFAHAALHRARSFAIS